MKFQLFILVSLQIIVVIQSQSNDERDFPPERMHISRTVNPTFASKFSRGRCPEYFYQLADECVFFANDGKIYSWRQIERICSRRIARMVEQFTNSNPDQPNLKPTNGVRQLVLNTPEKTEMLRSYYQIYSEQNFAVRLPSDYNTLRRCVDGKDDKWPHYCMSSVSPNASCFETVSHTPGDICVREIECEPKYVRLACEFTLPGSPELASSKFRHCPKVRGRSRRLPIWMWIVIAVAGAVLILGIISVILLVARKTKQTKSKPKSFPGRIPGPEKTIHINTTKPDPTLEPMLNRKPPQELDTGYLQPRPSDRAAPTTADGTSSA